jgi:NOL1/NOP2/fmu family ribosome biogenesis protein
MTLKILSNSEKQRIEKRLNENYGIEKIPGMIVQIGKERLFIFQGAFNEKQIKKIESLIPIERVGVYFAKIVDKDIKLSIEGVQILKSQIKKNIFQLNDEQTQEWMLGRDLEIQTGKKGFIIIKNKEDFLGSGKASAEKLGNFIPKSRRLRERII